MLVFCHISDKTLTKEFRNDLDFLDSFVRLEGNVGHAGVHHEAEEVENEVGMAAQVEEGGVALPPELLVVLAVHAPESFDHLLAQLHGRR